MLALEHALGKARALEPFVKQERKPGWFMKNIMYFYNEGSKGDDAAKQSAVAQINLECDKVLSGQNLQELKTILELGSDWNLEQPLQEACQKGEFETAEYLISKGAKDFNQALYEACLHQRWKFVNMLISKGVTDFNPGFRGAAKGGHINLVYLMYEKGARDVKGGIKLACEEAHVDVVEFMLLKGASRRTRDFIKCCTKAKDKTKIEPLCDLANELDEWNFWFQEHERATKRYNRQDTIVESDEEE